MERWLSGRKHVPAKDAYLCGYRGFESLSFRSIFLKMEGFIRYLVVLSLLSLCLLFTFPQQVTQVDLFLHYFFQKEIFSLFSLFSHLAYYPLICFFSVLFLSFFLKSWKKKRRTLSLLSVASLLHFIFNIGLFGYWICKRYIARPRPLQISSSKGELSYLPLSELFSLPVLPSNPHDSFPSGHTMVAFFFLLFPFLKKYDPLPLFSSRLFFSLSLLFGCSVAVGRVALREHFFSDVLFSWIWMTLSPLWIDRLLFLTYWRKV